MWDTFVHKLDPIISQFVPLVKGASDTVRKKPWLPLSVRHAIAAKAAAWRQWRLNLYKDTKARYNMLAKTAKSDYLTFVSNKRNLFYIRII